jgi:hypothetical protein
LEATSFQKAEIASQNDNLRVNLSRVWEGGRNNAGRVAGYSNMIQID